MPGWLPRGLGGCRGSELRWGRGQGEQWLSLFPVSQPYFSQSCLLAVPIASTVLLEHTTPLTEPHNGILSSCGGVPPRSCPKAGVSWVPVWPLVPAPGMEPHRCLHAGQL